MKDILGKTLQVGDTVALATCVGTSAELKIREIVDLEGVRYIRVKNPKTGRSRSASVSNMLIINDLV